MAKYLILVSPQAVDAFHHHKVIWLQRPKKGLIARSVEVFAALVVDEDVLAFNGEQRQRIKLAVEVLIFARYASVTVNAHVFLSDVRVLRRGSAGMQPKILHDANTDGFVAVLITRR